MSLIMKSILSSSRRVADDQETCDGKIEKSLGESDGQDCTGKYNSLTVWRKSLVLNCKGFTVIDSNGNLIYRVDNYICKPGQIILMNASGKSILSMRRQKTMQLGDSWQVYKGEENDKKGKTSSPKKQGPLWYVNRHISSLLQANSKQLVHVFVGTSSSTLLSSSNTNTNITKPAYVIEGSYRQRSCKILDKSTTSNKVVAEIKPKEAINDCASFGQDVFHLIVWAGFDSDFAMALVLLLDQMFS